MQQEKSAHGISLKVKMIVMVLISMVITVVLILTSVIPMIKKNYLNTMENYMMDICNTTGASIDAAITRSGGAIMILNQDALENLIGTVKMSGIDSSYAYVVKADGTVVYHPDADKIGKPVDTEIGKELIADIGSGEMPEQSIQYTKENEKEECASFYVTKNATAVLIIMADVSELLEVTTVVRNAVALVGTVISVIMCILIYLAIAYLMKPLLVITEQVQRFSALDFTENEIVLKISTHKDEMGRVAAAIYELREKMSDIVSHMKEQSKVLAEMGIDLERRANSTTEAVDNVEKAVSEITEGATEQAEETKKATEHVLDMEKLIQSANLEADNLKDVSLTMQEYSDQAVSEIKDLGEVNTAVISYIDIISEQTDRTNASAVKIKEATDLIAEIAEETNLLSLNASIEAARAGEVGRGFAVVAAQIQKLAEQSNHSASRIDAITRELIDDAKKAVSTMDDVKKIIQKQSDNVLRTSEKFQLVQSGIVHSATGVQEIELRTAKLDDARGSIVSIVQNLMDIAQQNAASTEETSASVMEVTNVMQVMTENANRLTTVAASLEDTVDHIRL